MQLSELETMARESAKRVREGVTVKGIYRWNTELSNRVRPDSAYGTGYVHVWDDDPDCVRVQLFGHDALKEPERCVFLWDDGKAIVPLYVAGWSGKGEYLTLHSMPVNPNGKRRADNGREIDYSNWQLGPRRAYHLKVSEIPTATVGEIEELLKPIGW